MTTKKRDVPVALETMLVNNEPVRYAHLIKFERPSKPDALTGRVSTSAERYTYLTDASMDIKFDDGTVDLLGRANGTQTYLANKVLSVGAIQEQTKATTSSTSIVLDGTSIGAYVVVTTATISSASANKWNISVPSLQEVINAGFREGDKVVITNVAVNINKFKSGNVLEVSKIDSDLSVGTFSNMSIELASEEIISILLDKTTDEYASFINREVYIYKAYFDAYGNMIGRDSSTYKNGPVLLFKGIIYSSSFDDSENSIKVTWGLNSHWGDFAQVKGRITSDSYHRALDTNGVPQPESAAKREYAYDLGFVHAESSINMLATYTVMVEKMDVKSKKGFFGIGASVKTKKYFVPEERHTNLDFELNAKNIPVIYGVRMVEGIPVFADTMANDSSDVFIATVLGEGEIGGIYDIYIEGNSLICNDVQDYDARSVETYNSVQDNNIELVCSGRADRGDALGGITSVQDAEYNYSLRWLFGNLNVTTNQPLAITNKNRIQSYEYQPSMYLDFDDKGLLDGDSITLEKPQRIVLDVFSGKPGQAASTQLTNISYAGIDNPDAGFKIQKSYWKSDSGGEYWGPNHRLLDTAYVVGRYKIEEGSTTIPEIKYVVRGKVLNCYNYDYSYSHYKKATSESADNFKLGSYVSIFDSNNNPILPVGGSVNSYQIIDKWTFVNPDGTYNTRFRYDKVPNLVFDINGVPSITKFKMRNGSNQYWTMITYNHNEYYSPTSGGPVYSMINQVTGAGTISSLIDPSDLDYEQLTTQYASTDFAQLSYAQNPDILAVPDSLVSYVITLNDSPVPTSVYSGSYPTVLNKFIGASTLFGRASGTTLTSAIVADDPTVLSDITTYAVGKALVATNCIKLSSDPSGGVDDYFKGYIIEVSRYNSTTGKLQTQIAEVVKYIAASKIIIIESMWEFLPLATDSVRIYQKYADSRISINPAIQTLDYVTASTYGRGLNIYTDIDMPSWLLTARKCDTQSNVTVKMNNNVSAVLPGAVYRYSSGDNFWQGEVVQNFSTNYVEFTNCIGKLTNKWNSWKSWKVGDILYNSSYQLFTVTTAGVIPQEPTTSNSVVTAINNIILTKVSSDSSPATLTTISGGVEGNPIQSIKDGQTISGYSLYDCDDVTYWRHSGWDEHSQRYATKFQTNAVIDTAAPLFDNTNSLLDHFNGIMRYSSGKYYLDIEEKDSTIDLSDIRTLTVDDIIGSIKLTDEGSRSAFNSLSAAFADPANKYEARTISFFNSDYLKVDRNVPKKGNLSVPAITNYYNTRLLAESFLNKSRFGLSINLTVRTHGILLLAGTVIQIIYPRYGWDSPGKKFRIESITYQEDGLTDIVAKEYDDSFYEALKARRGLGGVTGAATTPGVVLMPQTDKPVNLQASVDRFNQIRLTWEAGPNASESSYTEIWRSDSADFSNPSIIAVVPNTTSGVNEYIDIIPPELAGDAYIPKYYRIRRRIIR